MISRRDKLLVKPWEERRYNDHRRKVQSAVAAVDTRPPPARPHVELKLKKLQREAERSSRIQSDNFSLLQRLGALMSTNRLDNRWTKPLPSFQRKVGQYYDVKAVANVDTPPANTDTPTANKDTPTATSKAFKCYACAHKGLVV